VYLQKGTKGDETVQAKRAFEAFSRSHGVSIRQYHADNGRFVDHEWRDHLEAKDQTISFSGVHAHFQNALAERRIRQLQDSARTMLVHVKHRWPRAINSHLWPYALRMANDLHMNTPTISGKAPIELFSQFATATDPKHYHPFGCPVYVLSERQAADGKGAKWVERSRVGINIGSSPVHARNVTLVLNVETANASPQFQIKHDDLFETVSSLKVNMQWQVKTGFKRTQTTSTEPDAPEPVFLPPIDVGPDPDEHATDDIHQFFDNQGLGSMNPSEGAPPEPTTQYADTLPDSTFDMGSPVTSNEEQGTTNADSSGIGGPSLGAEPDSSTNATPTVAPSEYRTRTRVIRPPQRFQQAAAFIAQAWDDIWDIQDYEIQEDMSDPIAFAASSDPDTMYMHEALREPDRAQFLEAMQKEIKDHEDLRHWELVPRSDIPQGTTVLPSVWSMKRKRRIDMREVYRWKARLNLHGGKQIKNVHYWETYSPVVKWSSIRLFLTLAAVRGWHSRQVDFVLAYPQADIETEMYMEIPRGFEYQHSRKTHCLKLIKNLYGQRQAGRVWNKHLHKGLITMGFTRSDIDKCVYYRGTTIFLCYVDDSILIDPNPANIDKVFQEFNTLKYKVTDKGEIDDYLGVKIERLPDGAIKFTQPHLIDNILRDLGLLRKEGDEGEPKYETKTCDTPAQSTTILSRDTEGQPHEASWSYRSVIGKLNFLEKSSRPDLAYAVHNCARFSSDPKVIHGRAVKRIGRYLLGTRDKGIIMRPDPTRSVEVHADADFCGLFDPETAVFDPITAKSRTGYVVSTVFRAVTTKTRHNFLFVEFVLRLQKSANHGNPSFLDSFSTASSTLLTI
jgi:hypothetical protein